MPKHSPWEVPRNVSGPRIREARLNLRMSQAELSARLQVRGVDVTQRSVSDKERQFSPVFDTELLAFAAVLEVTPLWLLGEE